MTESAIRTGPGEPEDDDVLRRLLGADFGKDLDGAFEKVESGGVRAVVTQVAVPEESLYEVMVDLMVILQTLQPSDVEDHHCGVGYISAAVVSIAQNVLNGSIADADERRNDAMRIDAETAKAIGVAYLNLFFAHHVRRRLVDKFAEKYGEEQ